MTSRDETRRRLTEEERQLWSQVARTVGPLRRRTKERVAGKVEHQEPAQTRKPAGPAAPFAAARAAKKPPALAPLDRRTRQRLARGIVAIDRRLDLHGLTQREAHGALNRFLRAAQAEGAVLALVITGKGARAGGDPHGGRGVLRRLVPHWLSHPDLRELVVGFEEAHLGHGGEGALYVRLRRPRRR